MSAPTMNLAAALADAENRLTAATDALLETPSADAFYSVRHAHVADVEALTWYLRDIAGDDCRLLRRFRPRDAYADRDAYFANSGVAEVAPLKTALYVDVETTGTDTVTDRIIELAMVPFEFDAIGRIYDVGCPLTWFNDPGVPIPAEVTALTSITDNMVRGRSIDDDQVRRALDDASLVVAHHAEFDRKMLERRLPAFAGISWGCSYREVEWDRFGCTSGKLVHILADTCREFYDAHRATDDCLVGIHVLASAMRDNRSAFAELLDSVRLPTMRVFAHGAPFEVKDRLKARKYRWDGTHRVWFTDVDPDEVHDELQWLTYSASVFNAKVEKLTARERYSVRADR